jgi:hypothetical protein
MAGTTMMDDWVRSKRVTPVPFTFNQRMIDAGVGNHPSWSQLSAWLRNVERRTLLN